MSEDRAERPGPRSDFTADNQPATSDGFNVRSSNPDRSVTEAKGEVAALLPGFLTHKVTGERVYFGGLSPRQVPKAWAQGITDAGFRAKAAQVHLGGGKYKTLSLVVQFDCPFDHVDESGEGWAKVLLKVNPYTGWVSIHSDSCRRCTQEQIEAWLLTCPRCASGEDLDKHPDHDAEGRFYLPDGDESPIAYVAQAMWHYLQGQSLVGDSKGETTTVAGTVEWLAKLVTDDGQQLVPPTMGQNAAWAAVKHIPGCPTQALVRDAQAKRKAGGTG